MLLISPIGLALAALIIATSTQLRAKEPLQQPPMMLGAAQPSILDLLGASDELGQVIKADQAHSSATSKRLVLIDIRSPQEWKETGIPASAKAITVHQAGNIFERKVLMALGFDRSKPVALICATGPRSTFLQRRMKQMGFTSVMNVAEGFHGGRFGPGWTKRGLPVKRWAAPPTITPKPGN